MILITRPKEQSKEFTEKLLSRDLAVFQESLYNIKYKNINMICDQNFYYIFPSIHSVNCLVKNNQIKKFTNANIFVIGNKVKKKLLKLGCKKLLEVTDDSQLLIKVLKKNKYIDQKFIYLGSNIINEVFFKNLKEINIKIQRKIIYKTIPTISLSKSLISKISSGKINTAAFYSYLSVKNFLKLLIKHKINSRHLKNNFQIFCLSERIAEQFRIKNFKLISVAKKPQELELVNLIIKTVK